MLIASASDKGRSPHGIALVPPAARKLITAKNNPVAAKQFLNIRLSPRANVFSGDHHIVKPNALALLPKLSRRVTGIAAIMLEPKAVHLHIRIITPVDACEVADLAAIDPHGLLAIRFARRVRLHHEFPALPFIELR